MLFSCNSQEEKISRRKITGFAASWSAFFIITLTWCAFFTSGWCLTSHLVKINPAIRVYRCLFAPSESHLFCFSGAGVGVIPKRKMGWMPTHGCGNNTRTNSSRNIWLANLQSQKATILWNQPVNTVWESNMFHSNESEISIKNFLPQSSGVQS